MLDEPPAVRITRDVDVPDDLWKSVGRNIGTNNVRAPGPDWIVVPVDAFLARRAWLGQALASYGCDAAFDDGVMRLLRRSDEERDEVRRAIAGEINPFSPEQVSEMLANTRWIRNLREFQLRDLGKLLALSHGANFSVPGAGKTTVAYALNELEHERGRVDRMLVVAPLSAFDSWFDEAAESLSPVPLIHRFEGAIPLRADVVLINYQRLAARYNDVASWVLHHNCHVVLDEAHRMKRGRDGEWGNACLNLAQIAVRRDILTGTPAPQHPSDFVALLNYLWPNQATRILPAGALQAAPPTNVMANVSTRLQPLFARTRKDELGLSRPILRVEQVEMKPVQAGIYETVRSRLRRATLSRKDQTLLAGLGEVVMYLLEAATNPALLASAIGGDPSPTTWPPNPVAPGTQFHEQILTYGSIEVPAKFEKLAALVASNARAGRKTLVWSNFVANLTEIGTRLLAPFNPAIVHGGIPTSATAEPGSREDQIRRFRHEESCQVLVANPAAMAEGISLHHTCHEAIYLDRTFNAGQYLQSLDRIHRLGLPPGTRTRMTFLVCNRTIDEVVDDRVRTKSRRLSEMLSDPNLVTMALPDDEAYGNWIEDVDDVGALLGHLRRT